MQRFHRYLSRQHLAFLLAMAIVPLLFWLSIHNTDQLAQSTRWVEHTYRVLARIERLNNHVEVVETARRGYVLTRQEQYLRPYYYAQERLETDLRDLRELVADNPQQEARVRALKSLADGLVAIARRTIDHPDLAQQDAAGLMDSAKTLIDELRIRMEEMRDEESHLLAIRTQESLYRLGNQRFWQNTLASTVVLLLLYSFWAMARENAQRREVEAGLREMQAINEITVSNLSIMREMSSMLQACANIGEALEVIRQYMSRLVNVDGGMIYLFRESRNQIESLAQWGLPTQSSPTFGPDDCWALRRGGVHLMDHAGHALACKHVHADTVSSLCMPVVAQGNVLGILYLENQHRRPIGEAECQLVDALASQVALALASIKLRDTLSTLSVRDPLTGLFNRRYMEESLQREIAIAERQTQPLSVAILDLDHFKRFNDTFGHEAGDLLLRKAANLLSARCRASDIACRFGGEEFVIIYPGASLEDALVRANELREAIYALQLQHFGRSLGQVSASFGLAGYPKHGNNGEALLRSADVALYRAKENGRNRVEIAILDDLKVVEEEDRISAY